MTRRFLRGERGGVAIESALALSILVGAFAVLMPIVGDVFAEDRTGRSARGVARAIAVDPGADPWAVLRREMGLDENHNCTALSGSTPGTCGAWTLTVHRGVSPATLATVFGGGAAADGEMILVRLEKPRPSSRLATVVPSANAQTTQTTQPPQSAGSGTGATMVGIGLARREPED